MHGGSGCAGAGCRYRSASQVRTGGRARGGLCGARPGRSRGQERSSRRVVPRLAGPLRSPPVGWRWGPPQGGHPGEPGRRVGELRGGALEGRLRPFDGRRRPVGLPARMFGAGGRDGCGSEPAGRRGSPVWGRVGLPRALGAGRSGCRVRRWWAGDPRGQGAYGRAGGMRAGRAAGGRAQAWPKRKPTPRTVMIQLLEPSLPRRLLTWVSMVRPGRDQESSHTCVISCLRETTVSGWEASR